MSEEGVYSSLPYCPRVMRLSLIHSKTQLSHVWPHGLYTPPGNGAAAATSPSARNAIQNSAGITACSAA
jgi:hypothetical protein